MSFELSSQYLAGLLDGEGYIGITKHSNKRARLGFDFRPTVSIDMCRADELLKVIAEKYGGLYYDRKRRPSHRQPISQISIDYYKVKNILQDVLPYLIIKREQAELLLRFLEYTAGDERHVTDDDLRNQVELYNELKKLNIRGVGKPKLAKFNPRPSKKKFIRIPQNTLNKLYMEDKFSILAISHKYGVSNTAIKNALVKTGFKLRSRGEQVRLDIENGRRIMPVKKKVDWDLEKVRRLYWDEGLSMREVGEAFGVKHTAVLRFMKENNIPRRGASESTKLALSKL